MFNLIEFTDAHMTKKNFSLPRGIHFYPSEANVRYKDEHGITRVIGTCLRQAYYRTTKEAEYKEPDAHTQWIFALGSAVENILVEQWKQAGIWVANSIRFYDEERNISGELDVVLADPETGERFGVEVKSFYGYNAGKNICGNTKQKGKPKDSQLLQTLIYVDLCQKLGLLDYFKMVYYSRDSSARAEFDIRLTEINGEKYPTINGIVDHRFTMADIYNGYQTLSDHIESGTVPERDFDINWSAEKVEQRKLLDEVAKTTYEKWKKNPKSNPIGDWQCNYCGWKNHCYSK